MQKADIIPWQNLAPLDSHLFSLMKEGLRGKHYASNENVKPAIKKWPKEQDYMVSFKIRTLLLSGDYVKKKECDPQRTKLILMYDTRSCVGNYSCIKEKGITFWLTFVEFDLYLVII